MRFIFTFYVGSKYQDQACLLPRLEPKPATLLLVCLVVGGGASGASIKLK